jgi:hypothetical protein
MDIKRIFSKIWVDDYLIKFEYDTKRKNHKEQTRRISHISEDLARRDFIRWIDVNNSDKPYRAMLNVKILSIEKENGRYITLKDNGTYAEV